LYSYPKFESALIESEKISGTRRITIVNPQKYSYPYQASYDKELFLFLSMQMPSDRYKKHGSTNNTAIMEKTVPLPRK